ncbi:MAG: hypothetical protein ABJA66_06475 [Actinomycetota bacterium]
MPVKSKKILITTESREIFIVRTNNKSFVSGFCADCAREVELLNLDLAVSFSQIFALELIGQIQSGAIHSIETESGHLLVCQDSLNRFWQVKKGEIL